MQALTKMRRGWLMLAVGGGVLLGLAYTLSPLTIWVALGAVAIVRVATRGLPERERRWLTGILVVAFALRFAAVAALFLASPHDRQAAGILFGDESYALYRSWRLRDAVLGLPLLKYDYLIVNDQYGQSSYIPAIAFVQLLVGPSPYGLRLLNSLLFIGAMLWLFRMAYRAFGTAVAFGGLTALLFLPTLFAWSISLLKESFYFVLTVVVLATAVEAVRRPSWPARVASVCACGAALWLLKDLRAGATALAVAGLAAGFGARFVFARGWRIGAAGLALTVCAVLAVASPAAQARLLRGIDAAAVAQTGHVYTVGHAYKLLDEPFYMFPDAGVRYTLTPSEAGRFVIRGLVSYLVVPVPWRLATMSEAAYLPEQIVWYVLLALAPLGIVIGYRHDKLVTSLIAGYLVPTAVVVALTTGNVGTLIRHRTLIVPYLVWLSAVGACAVVGWMTRKGLAWP